MTNPEITLTQLGSIWHALPDLDRSEEVRSVHRAGVTLREIANHLNCSPALLTRLLQAAQAPYEDIALARKGLLSTRALERRARTLGIHRAGQHREEIAFEREREALQGNRATIN